MRIRSLVASTVTLVAVLFLGAAAANAGVIVSYSNDAVGPLTIGDSVNITVSLSWDGTNPDQLTGVFTSTAWDPSVLSFQGATEAPFAIFFGPNGFLSKITDPQSFPGDPPSGTLRTIQFGIPAGQSAVVTSHDHEAAYSAIMRPPPVTL